MSSVVALPDWYERNMAVVDRGIPKRLFQRSLDRADREDKSFTSGLNPDECYDIFLGLCRGEYMDGLQGVVLNDTHLFLYTVSRLWFKKGDWLIEQFYMRLNPRLIGNPLETLTGFARALDVQGIIFATMMANDNALGSLLQGAGYTQQSTQYVKEL